MVRPSIGILGMGSIGSRHAKNFISLGCPIHAYDPKIIGSILQDRDMLMRQCDAVVIATPTSRHRDDLFFVARYGKPIFVEKPISAEPLTDVSEYIKMVGYNLRFHSCVKKVREWLGQGLIGKPIWARFTCAQFNDKPQYRRDGVLLNWSHELDLALYLLGRARFTAVSLRNDPEDLAVVILRHDNNDCYTTVHLDYLTRVERRGFVIIGEEGSIDTDLVNRQTFLKNNKGQLIHSFGGRDTFDSNYIAEAQAFLDRLEGKETLGCTAQEANDVVRLCTEAKEMWRYE